MWREITEADVLGVLSDQEKTAYQTTAIATEQDPCEDIIISVVHFCRGYIADNPTNQLADGITLPERTIRAALHLIRKDLLTRLDVPVSEDRRRDATEALRFFERVADGKVSVEQPTGATDDSGTSVSIDVISQHERLATRQNLAGL